MDLAQLAPRVQLTARRQALTDIEDDAWTDEAESELERIEARLEEIQRAVADRAVFRRKDLEIAGAIVTIADDGALRLIQGLVRPEDLAGPADGGSSPVPNAWVSGARTKPRSRNAPTSSPRSNRAASPRWKWLPAT